MEERVNMNYAQKKKNIRKTLRKKVKLLKMLKIIEKCKFLQTYVSTGLTLKARGFGISHVGFLFSTHRGWGSVSPSD